MPVAVGDRLGPYEILAHIGKGGMGDVYRARDTRLNRDVAIKFSEDRFSERFEREAQAIAALNHPHICSLYDVGPDYLVMEYVEGKPLSGPVPVEEALTLAGQILDALDAAHRKGITHRDLKPGNILVGKTGVKVLDFGLAKFEHDKPESGATETMPLTSAGTIVGTLQYMSPEQIEGEPVDARSDIFAFGLVLYELLTGKRAFTGKSKTSLLASILKEEPRPVRELQPLAPQALERVIQTCLEKDPEKRWQSAREVKHALEWMAAQSPAPAQATAPAPRPVLPWLLAGAFALIAVAAVLMLWPKPAAPARSVHFQIPIPENVEYSQFLAISPDGRKLVFDSAGAQSGLWVHDLDTLEWRKLPDTEGAFGPFWSPDSRYIAFSVRNQLKKIDVAGGPPLTLCTVPGVSGSGAWGQDGIILFDAYGTGIVRKVSAAGGLPTDVTAVDAARGERAHGLPGFLPDGKHFIYLILGTPDVEGMYMGSVDAKPPQQPRERILPVNFAARYLDGKLFFLREGTLMMQPFDSTKLRLQGEPIPIAEHVATTGALGIFSFSNTGVLAYRTGASDGGNTFHATWMDRQGKPTGTIGEPNAIRGIKLSPDATRAAGRDAGQQLNGDIWILDLARGLPTRLTFLQSTGSFPVWSPDGRSVIFSAGSAFRTIYEKAANGTGNETQLLKQPQQAMFPTSWSRDGRFLLYHTGGGKTGNDLWVLPLAGERKPVLLLGTQFNELDGSFSPDGRWIAYISNESGRPELYVRPFAPSGSSGPSLGDGKWQLSKDGILNREPHWRNDGKEIIFASANGSAMAVEVNGSGAAFETQVPKQLFRLLPNNGWDVTGDHQRFLMALSGAQQAQQSEQTPLTVVLNWQADLKK